MKPITDMQGTSPGYRHLVLGLLTMGYTLNFLDRQLLAILAEPIKADLHLSDTHLGLLGGLVFALLYASLGIPLAAIADRVGRAPVLALSCLCWSLFTAACGVAQSFAQLALARLGVAIGESGGTPPSHAIISDLYPADRRALALAIFSLGLPLGIMAGGLLGGFIAAHWGWRAAFLIVSVPGLILAAIIPLVVRERPIPRDQQAPVSAAVSDFVTHPAIRILTLSASLAAAGGYGLLNWTPAFLMRAKGMSLDEISIFYGPVMGLALAVGTFGGGFIATRFGVRRPSLYALVPAMATAASAFFLLVAVQVESRWLSLALLAVPAAAIATYLAPALALLQNVSPPSQRATASAILLLILNLVGLGGGPLIVGVISDRLASSQGDASLGWGLAALAPVLVASSIAYLALARRLAAEIELASPPGPLFAGDGK